MAEETNVYDQNMTKSPVHSDIGEDICDKENLDENGEEEEIDPNFVEERFRVDRRKLEQMIQDPGEDETAEDFFLRVMHETDTTITWPSKLKIGAKSKKDPHIKVSGDREAVGKAKDMVMTVLDTKSTRVTLKMDVSYTEHSHVIGKGGNNIKKVMQDTGCHIHFPDSNRNNQAEKSNQVSIAGQPAGVEQARVKIRELLPLVFMFELPMTGVLQPIPDANSPTLKQIQDNYAITVSFKQRPQVYMTTVIIRGTVHNAKSVKEGTMRVIEHLTGNIGNTTAVSMQLEIAPQHHLFIIGRAGANIKQIMQQTGATIHFPDPNSTQTPRKGTVYLTGPIESVCLARQHLIGCLPLVLMFDMKEDSDIDQAKMTQLMEQLDVFISIKPKPKQPSKSVIVKSIERNASKLYEARRRLLGLSEEDIPTVSSDGSDGISSTAISFSALGLLGHNLLKINTTNNPLLLLNGTAHHRSPLATTTLAMGNQVTCTLPSNLITTSQQGSQLYAPQNVVLVPRHSLPGAVATVASVVPRLTHHQAVHSLKVPATVAAANLGGLAIPVMSQQKPKTLKDINQNVQNSSPPSSSPSHPGSPLRGSTFSSQSTGMESSPSTPPQEQNHQQHHHLSMQQQQKSPLHQVSALSSPQRHPLLQQQQQQHQAGGDLKLNQEALLQKLKQNHQYHADSPPSPSGLQQHSGDLKLNQEALLQRLKLNHQYHTDSPPSSHLQQQQQQQQLADLKLNQEALLQKLKLNHQYHADSPTPASGLQQQADLKLDQEMILQKLKLNHQYQAESPPPSSGLQQHGDLKINQEALLQKLKLNHQYHADSPALTSHLQQQADLKLNQEMLLQKLKLNHQYPSDSPTPPSRPGTGHLYQTPVGTERPSRPPPGLPPPPGSLRPTMSLNNSSSPLDLISQTTTSSTSIASPSSSPHSSPQPQIDLSSLKSGQELLDLLLPNVQAAQDAGMNLSGLNRADRTRSLLSTAAGDLFSTQSALNSQHLQDLTVQQFSHLTDSSVSVTGHHHTELTSPQLKPGSPQLPAHPPDSPLPPGLRLPHAAMILNQQSLLSEDDVRKLSFQSDRRSSLVSNNSSDSDSSEHKLVSGLPPNPASSLFSGEAILEAFDYEHKKLMATKAMSKKPLGESRIPTDVWSGLGFSKSMPDSAIRDKLRENNVRKYQGPSMATTYEADLSSEEDKDPWKDSPLQSPSNSFNAGMRQRRTPPSPASPIQQHSIKTGDYNRSSGSSGGQVQAQKTDWPPTTDLAELFSQLGLGKYTYLFQEQEIDMATFLTLTDIDLKELGIATFGARRKMLLAIADLSKKQTLSAAPGANNPFRKMGTLEKNGMLGRRGDIVSQSGRW